MPSTLKLDQDATLVVVDVQALTLPNARSVAPEVLLARVSRLTAAFRRSRRAVAYAISTGTARGRTETQPGPRTWPKAALALSEELRPSPGDRVYERGGWSAFAGTTLAADLTDRGGKQVVVAGIATTFGVESTVRAAYDLGLDVVVVVDAISDPSPDGHERAVRSIFPLLAVTTTTDAVLDLADPTA